MSDVDRQTSKCRRCEGTHYGSYDCPFLGEVPCAACGKLIHAEAGSDASVHPHRRFDHLGRVYHASCEQDAPIRTQALRWSVSVERDGRSVVTLSHNHLAGRDLSPEDEDAIRTAALHLLAFIGAPSAPPETPRATK